MRVAMHVLKAGLSRYVAHARAGAVIEVTSHDKPVVRIVGIPSGKPVGPPGVAALLASDAARWSGGKPAFQSPITLGSGGKTLGELIAEDRG